MENFFTLFLILEARQRKQIIREEEEIPRTGNGMMVLVEAVAGTSSGNSGRISRGPEEGEDGI